MLPHAVQGGLIEVATPECRSPAELVLYQRAQERLMVQALPGARLALAAEGFRGELSLLKNCRDAFNNIYGPQENYEAEVANGVWLWALRIGVTSLLPVAAATALVYLPLGLVLVILMFVVAISVGLAEAIAEGADRVPSQWVNKTLSGFGLVWLWVETIVTAPLVTPALLLLRWVAFRPQRRGILAHLVSRPIFIGGGTLIDGRFELDEKAPAMVRTSRLTVLPGDHAVFEVGNLVKLLFSPMMLKPSAVLKLYGRRQRFQLGLSSSNMAQHAEYLKVGTTGLVITMAEAGQLEDAPQLRDPIGGLKTLCGDDSLTATVRTDQGELTALEIQRWYQRRAEAYVSGPATSIEARDVVRQWGETLDALASDPESLVGRVDWVTKRTLLRAGRADGLSEAALKKIDLRYHELGTGYFAALEDQGLARQILDPAEIETAIRRPPQDTPAAQRASLLRRLRDADQPVHVAWDHVRVGGRLRGKVIRLDDHR